MKPTLEMTSGTFPKTTSSNVCANCDAYACSPNLVLSSFQYDTESQKCGTNTRLRWTIKPNNNLLIGWNRGWQRLILSPNDTSIVPQSDVIAVKLR